MAGPFKKEKKRDLLAFSEKQAFGGLSESSEKAKEMTFQDVISELLEHLDITMPTLLECISEASWDGLKELGCPDLLQRAVDM